MKIEEVVVLAVALVGVAMLSRIARSSAARLGVGTAGLAVLGWGANRVVRRVGW